MENTDWVLTNRLSMWERRLPSRAGAKLRVFLHERRRDSSIEREHPDGRAGPHCRRPRDALQYPGLPEQVARTEASKADLAAGVDLERSNGAFDQEEQAVGRVPLDGDQVAERVGARLEERDDE